MLIGNLKENDSESIDDLVEKLFTDTLKVHCKPSQVLRIGKRVKGTNRLVLVKMNSFKERLMLLKAAKNLRGSNIFIMEDLSKSDRNRRKVLVEKLKRARSEGKKAFIRFTDGKLIVDGKIIDFTMDDEDHGVSPFPSQQ